MHYQIGSPTDCFKVHHTPTHTVFVSKTVSLRIGTVIFIIETMVFFAFITPSPVVRQNVGRSSTISACASRPEGVPLPPTSLELTVPLATQAITDALDAGHTRLRLNALIPGLNPAVEQSYPYSVAALNTLARSVIVFNSQLSQVPSCSLLFSSTGAAAMASSQYIRDESRYTYSESEQMAAIPVEINMASFAKRDAKAARTSPHVNVIVAPISSRGDPVMDDIDEIMLENPEATWILLNADFGVDRAAVGMRESNRRAAFIASFTEAFYFRNLVSQIHENREKPMRKRKRVDDALIMPTAS